MSYCYCSKNYRSKAAPFEIQRSFFMNLIEVMEGSRNQEACLSSLERLR